MSLQQELARELDEKQVAIKSVQEEAERLIKNHPARPTIEVCGFVLRAAAATWRSARRSGLVRALPCCLPRRHTEPPCRRSGAGFCSCAPVWSSIWRRTLFISRCAYPTLPGFQQISLWPSVVVFLFRVRSFLFVAPGSFSATPKNPWTTLRTCEIPFRGSTAATRRAACTDWRISSRSQWLASTLFLSFHWPVVMSLNCCAVTMQHRVDLMELYWFQIR